MKAEHNLIVKEAISEDTNKQIARIDSSWMKKLCIKPGDIIEIEGKGKTLVRVRDAYPGDAGLNIIRLDGIIRRNAQVTIGEIVKIQKVNVTEATKVILKPIREIETIEPHVLKAIFLGCPVLEGNILPVISKLEGKGDLLFQAFSRRDKIPSQKFLIKKVEPESMGVIAENTKITIDNRIYEAMDFAEEKHKDHKRKYSEEPYTVHLLGVYEILKLVTQDEDILIASLLHDAIEDKKATYEEVKEKFGAKIADLVIECTKDEKKNFNIKSKEALMIKLADVLHNLSTNTDPWYIEKTLYMWHPKEMIPKYFKHPNHGGE